MMASKPTQDRQGVLAAPIRLSTLSLVTLGMADLVMTILLMGQGFQEGNPIFRGLLHAFGPPGFVAGKVFFIAGPILILEYVRTKRPTSAEQGTWIAFGAYFLMLVLQLWRLNGLAA